jgi:transposase
MMKLEDGMHSKTRRQYTEDFRRDAVQLVRESARPVAQVARDLGIPENRLYRWRAQHRQAELQETTRAGPRIEAEDLLRLKRELTRVTQERDFLTRAAAFFAKESP